MICLAKHLQVKLLLLLAVAALWCLPALAWADTGNASSEEDKAASQIYAIYASGQEGNGANSSNSNSSACTRSSTSAYFFFPTVRLPTMEARALARAPT